MPLKKPPASSLRPAKGFSAQSTVPRDLRFRYSECDPKIPETGEYFVLDTSAEVWLCDESHKPNVRHLAGIRWIVEPIDRHDHVRVARLTTQKVRIIKSELLNARNGCVWDWILDLDEDDGWEYINAKPK